MRGCSACTRSHSSSEPKATQVALMQWSSKVGKSLSTVKISGATSAVAAICACEVRKVLYRIAALLKNEWAMR